MPGRRAALGVPALVFLLDRLTKLLVEARLPVWETHVVIPGFFNLVHTRNTGAAFSLLADAAPHWRSLVLIGLSGVVSVFVAVLLWQNTRKSAPGSALLTFALALVLGGALGNLYDRLVAGAVTDFLEFYLGRFSWPAFNVADSAISVGAGLLILDLWKGRSSPSCTRS
jgi:signal peptidase II